MYRTGIFILFCLLFGACEKNDAGPLLLRIRNNSPYHFDQVYVSTGSGSHQYGSLASTGTSEYKKFRYIYEYGYIKLTINGQEVVEQPIDYVGEKKYRSGKYTYSISVTSIQDNRLRILFTKD
jgi:hypothetical protein